MLRVSNLCISLLVLSFALGCANSDAPHGDSADPYAQATFELDEFVSQGQVQSIVTVNDLAAEGRLEMLHVLQHGALSIEMEWEDPARLAELLEAGPLDLAIDFARMQDFLIRPEMGKGVEIITKDEVSHALRNTEIATICGTRKLMASGTIDVGDGPEAVLFGFEYLPRPRFASKDGALSLEAGPTDKRAGKTFVRSEFEHVIDWPIGVKGCPLSKNHKKCNKKNDCTAWIGPFEFEGNCGPAWIICDCWI